MSGLSFMADQSKRYIRMRGPMKTLVVLESVTWEMIGLRERLPHEKVHVRADEVVTSDTACDVCGVFGGVWVENMSSHAVHPNKCEVP